MKRRLAILVIAVTLILLLAAGAYAKEITVRGRLAPTVETGGWLIVAEREKYLILNARRFRDNTWFREAAEVEAAGETRPGVITAHQEGTPFEVRSMRPLGTSGASSGAGSTRVLVTGEAVVRAEPDTALLSLAVVTQNKNALEAQRDNAVRTDAVMRAVKAAAGAGAEVKTGGYQITPQRVYKENQPPTITGYEVRNAVVVTMNELNRVGAVIDAAAQSGANNVDSVSFTLREDGKARAQALTNATGEALGKARALAEALGGKFVRVAEVQEDSFRPRPVYNAEYGAQRAMGAAAAAPTPIEAGTLEIQARVQLVAEIETR
jgi:uncharacterized protein